MDTKSVIELLLAIIGSLLSVIAAYAMYEVKTLRRRSHKHASAITALNMIMHTICKKLGIVWKPSDEDE